MVADAVSEGTHVILGMLVVGCIFLAVIGIGEWTHRLGERRRERRERLRPY